jgi:transposase InsO family protein
MFVVEIYAAVRRFVFLEGHSRREASRVFGLSFYNCQRFHSALDYRTPDQAEWQATNVA